MAPIEPRGIRAKILPKVVSNKSCRWRVIISEWNQQLCRVSARKRAVVLNSAPPNETSKFLFTLASSMLDLICDSLRSMFDVAFPAALNC